MSDPFVNRSIQDPIPESPSERLAGIEAISDPIRRLVAIMATLRGPGGCPWDHKQTHQSLTPHLIEEAYEMIEAVEEGNDPHLVEELGDVLLQVVFHAQIAREGDRFDLDTVAQSICDKLIHRHPHVFGDAQAHTSQQVLSQWERIKAEEKRLERDSITSGIPKQLPALLRSAKLQKKVARVGFDWDGIEDVLAKVEEELAELRQSLALRDQAAIELELGDLLFSVVNVARFAKVDPEIALHRSIEKFIRRFRQVEQMVESSGRPIQECSLRELDAFWERAKMDEASD